MAGGFKVGSVSIGGGELFLIAGPCVIESERHRHRYEFNREYEAILTAGGLKITGATPDGTYVEIVELPGHPYFLGCQFHPEFKSKPLEPHPLFKAFIGASYEHGRKRHAKKEAVEVELFRRPEKVGKR